MLRLSFISPKAVERNKNKERRPDRERKQDNKAVGSFSDKINQDNINSGKTTFSKPTEERDNNNEPTAESKRVCFAHFSSVYQI